MEDTYTRDDVLAMLNQSGLASEIGKLKSVILNKVMAQLTVDVNDANLSSEDRLKQSNRSLLNAVGPAAAATAVDYAVEKSKQHEALSKVTFNCNYVQNVHLAEANSHYSVFSQNIREFLLPRFGSGDFDSMVDPKHMIDRECGYPTSISPMMYRYMYDRDDMARRVNDIYPDESWAADPDPYDDENEDIISPWEQEWADLCTDYKVLQNLYRHDKMLGIGRFGALLIAVEGESDLEKPIEETDLLNGVPRSISKKQRRPLYFRPFDECNAYVFQYETNPNHPRCGRPLYYNLIVTDVASIGGTTKTLQRVHWTRVLHGAENMESSLTMGTPRSRPVFNRLLDLRKIKGSSAEMFWKGGFPGISFEINPEYIADNPDFDKEALKREIHRFSSGLQRYLQLIGVSAKTLQTSIADPKGHVFIQMQAISAHYGIPMRIFLGTESGQLASSQDKVTWNQRLKRRITRFVEPDILRAAIDRFVAIGFMSPPAKNRYMISWTDLNMPSDEDKSNLSLKWTQALSQYVSSGVIHLIEPMDYLTTILGLQPAKAKQIIANVNSKGGWAKLLQVDPAQGAAVNGKRTNMTASKNNGDQARKKRRSSGGSK